MRINLSSRWISIVAFSIGLAAAGPADLACVGKAARAQVIPTGPIMLELKPIATGLVSPVQLKSPPDNSGRLFVVDQAGKIRVIDGGVLLPAAFLDLGASGSGTIVTLNTGFDERGLLGLAFHPQFAVNGRFFVRYSRPRTGVMGVDPCFGTSRGCHTEVLAEYAVTPPSGNVASPTGTVLFTVDKPQFNHNSGAVTFGPDGFLYVTMGDGGGANDGLADMPPSHGPGGNAQNLAVSMGKMLRFDVSIPGVAAAPPSNPFFSTPGAYQPIFAYGLRNPYAFSFDDFGPGATNALILGDVGQNLFEELDVITAGGNYGWPLREGAHCFDPFAPNVSPPTCGTTGLIDPVFDYGRTNGISIIGGFVYRGSAFPALVGKYIFGDFSTTFAPANGHLFHCDMGAPASPTAPGPLLRPRIGATDRNLNLYVKAIGRDNAGDIYVLVGANLGPTGTSGQVLKVIPCPGDFSGSGTIEVGDIFVFLAAWFGNDPRADVNGQDGITVADIFAFLAAWFAGC